MVIDVRICLLILFRSLMSSLEKIKFDNLHWHSDFEGQRDFVFYDKPGVWALPAEKYGRSVGHREEVVSPGCWDQGGLGAEMDI